MLKAFSCSGSAHGIAEAAHLSATEPMRSEGVIAANSSWNTKNTVQGTVGANAANGAAPTLYIRPPISAGLPKMPALPGGDSPNANPNLQMHKLQHAEAWCACHALRIGWVQSKICGDAVSRWQGCTGLRTCHLLLPAGSAWNCIMHDAAACQAWTNSTIARG